MITLYIHNPLQGTTSLSFFSKAVGFGVFGHGCISALSPEALSHPDYWAMVHAPWGRQHISIGSLSTITNSAMLTWQEPPAGGVFGPAWFTLLENSIEQYWLSICTQRKGWQSISLWAANTLREGTCGQLMCVTKTGAHTGLVLSARTNFIFDTNSAVVITAVVKSTLNSERICNKNIRN